jgi:DNA mismatch repair protein MSH2
LSDSYTRLSKEYDDKQRHLVKEVVSIAASYTPVLEALDDLIAAVDVTVSLRAWQGTNELRFISFAHVAASAPTAYVKPSLHEKGQSFGQVILGKAQD